MQDGTSLLLKFDTLNILKLHTKQTYDNRLFYSLHTQISIIYILKSAVVLKRVPIDDITILSFS